jgi:dihydroflavonol-4-reductase
MKILMTGGNGFVGSRTMAELFRKGHQVRCLLRSSSKTDRIEHLPFEAYLGDIRDRSALRKAAQGCDAIFHLACVSSWAQIRRESEQLLDIVVEGTRNVLEAALDQRISRVLYVSSSAAVNGSKVCQVFNESTTFKLKGSDLKYSIAKHLAEELVLDYVRKFNLDAVIVNPAEVYGPNDIDFITSGNLIDILTKSPVVVCSGGTSIAHVEDIAKGICLAFEKGKKGERYILGGDNLTIAQLAKMARGFANKSDAVITLPNNLIIKLCKTLERMGLSSPFPLDVLDYAVMYWFVDSSKAVRELGYYSRPANETLAEVVQWLKETQKVA